jgi:O-antigen/teichoic acid export membrane protein
MATKTGARNLQIVLVSRVSIIIFGIISQSCLARMLFPSQRGGYAVALLFATLLSLVFAVGCDIACTYFVASKKLSVSQGVSNTLVLAFIGSLAAALTGAILICSPIPFFAKAPREAFWFSLTLVPVMMTSLAFRWLLTAVGEYVWFAIVSIMTSVSQTMLLVVFLWYLKWGIIGALLTQLLSASLVMMVTLQVLRRKCGLVWEAPSISSMKQMLGYGLRYYVAKLSNRVNVDIGMIIVALYASKSEIGFFAVASVLITRVTLIPDSLTTVLFPKVASSDKEGDRTRVVVQSAKACAIVCSVILLIMAAAARPIVVFLYGSAYMEAVLLIRILAIGVFLRCVSKVLVPYLIGVNRPGIASIAVTAGVITNLSVLLLLMPLIGLPGAAVGMTCSYVVSALILMVSFHRISGLKFLQTWHFNKSDFRGIFSMLKLSRRKKKTPLPDTNRELDTALPAETDGLAENPHSDDGRRHPGNNGAA